MKQTYSQKWRRLKAVMVALIILCSCGITALVTYAAAGDPTIYFGGNVSFTATGVNATVTAGEQSGLKITASDGVTTTGILDTLVYSTISSDSNSGDADSWKDLTVTLSQQTATFTFTIENTADSGAIGATISVTSYDSSVLSIGVTDGDDEDIKGSGQSIATGEILTIKIVFELVSTSYNTSSAFSISVNLTGSTTATDTTSTSTGYTLTLSYSTLKVMDSEPYVYISINGEDYVTLYSLLSGGATAIEAGNPSENPTTSCSDEIEDVKTIQIKALETEGVTGTITIGDTPYTIDYSSDSEYNTGLITLNEDIQMTWSLTQS